ncbi:MAG: hypothetical protein ATN36_09020 [Epulopiscium sp. Nele67-Bin005]|nr:MAG: hypothetical protein ATN36_09020 [Epulopiscium sp. Nele67-Bin005]
MNTVELLAPVGKLENAYAAIENGADAIFLGGKIFNARNQADNFDTENLREIINYCKLRGIKVYITLNTLIKNQELDSLFNYLVELQNLNIDAIIIQDLGIAKLVKQYFPTITLHASTQLSVHSVEDAKFLKSQGFKRIVLARELTLKEIGEIIQNVDIEIETFVHGALCYSYSGQCLMSSLIGGRSGNRGRCAQPCRMEYSLYQNDKIVAKNRYLLSPKDICTLDILPEILKIGVHSLKVEGRMKSPEYVASVIGTYRKYIDKIRSENNQKLYKVNDEDIKKLQTIFNRGGFSRGYYKNKGNADMITVKSPKNIGLKIGHVVSYDFKKKQATIFTEKELHAGDGIEIWNSKKHIGTGISKQYPAHKNFIINLNEPAEKGSLVYLSKDHQLLKDLKKTYEKNNRKLPISAYAKGIIGKPIELTLKYNSTSIKVFGEILEPAQNNPVTVEKVASQLQKFGATPFKINQFEIDWEENSYVVMSKLNELRRSATESLEAELLNLPQISAPIYKQFEQNFNIKKPTLVVAVKTLDQLEVAISYPQIETIYWEWDSTVENNQKAFELTSNSNKKFFIALPYIMKNSLWNINHELFFDNPEVGYLCRTLGQAHKVLELKKPCHLDYNLNITNYESATYWLNLGVNQLTISEEVNKSELKGINFPFQKIIYGHLPVMTTEQCLISQNGTCNKNNYVLEDRKKERWNIVTNCQACYMQILTQLPTYIYSQDLKSISNLQSSRVQFTIENKKIAKDVLESVIFGKPLITNTNSNFFNKVIE